MTNHSQDVMSNGTPGCGVPNKADCDETRPIQAHVIDVELSDDNNNVRRASPDGRYAEKAWILVRLFGQPLGLDVIRIPQPGISTTELADLIVGKWHASIARALGLNGESLTSEVVLKTIHAQGDSGFKRAHGEFAMRVPKCSVVICTREHPEELRRALDSLTSQDHTDFSVWVIDNAPKTARTQELVESFEDQLSIRYVREPRPGLSKARNKALECDLEGDVVAWLDDDEIADPMWLSELTRAFDGRPEVTAASGVVVPAELETREQIWFEQFGGHSKGRGFTAACFSPSAKDQQHPLYPLPPFGVGANMAFRTEALRRLGGFDEALGAGTLTQGAEDTKIFTDILRSGASTAYWPTAVTRHFHRRDYAGLRQQMRGYGSGLTAFYTATVLEKPSTMFELIRLAPRAVRDLTSSDSLRTATLEEDFPSALLAQNRRGMAVGPWCYLRARYRNWRSDAKRPARQAI
jgi:hypothetical protein